MTIKVAFGRKMSWGIDSNCRVQQQSESDRYYEQKLQNFNQIIMIPRLAFLFPFLQILLNSFTLEDTRIYGPTEMYRTPCPTALPNTE